MCSFESCYLGTLASPRSEACPGSQVKAKSRHCLGSDEINFRTLCLVFGSSGLKYRVRLVQDRVTRCGSTILPASLLRYPLVVVAITFFSALKFNRGWSSPGRRNTRAYRVCQNKDVSRAASCGIKRFRLCSNALLDKGATNSLMASKRPA